jgi:hypothetical protein
MTETITALKISTSKRGRLWPTEYWKPLVDAVTRGGAKHDPRLKCPDLRAALDDLMEVGDGRYWPRAGSPFSGTDDVALRLLAVCRVKPGSESVRFESCELPDFSSWEQIGLPARNGPVANRELAQVAPHQSLTGTRQ